MLEYREKGMVLCDLFIISVRSDVLARHWKVTILARNIHRAAHLQSSAKSLVQRYLSIKVERVFFWYPGTTGPLVVPLPAWCSGQT